MLDRYKRSEMQQIWNGSACYQNWLAVELAVCQAYRQVGKVPRSIADIIQSKASFDPERITELQNQGQEELNAFLISVSESLEPEEAKYLHMGISASDLKDTALSLTIKKAAELLDKDMEEFMEVLKELALNYKETACIARVHGVYSEPTSFGLKMLSYYDDIRRSRSYLKNIIDEVCVGMFSGATGAFTNLDIEIEKLASENLGIKPALVSTQVLGRDRLAMFINQLAVIASIVERLALEIRNLQRPEIAELEEPFLMKMGAANPLPHKRSPWRSESVTGLARIIRSYTHVGLDNIVLSHERDSSCNTTERIILPDACYLLDFIFSRMTQVMRGVVVYPKKMYQNLNKAGGVVFSQQIILRLIDKGMDKDMAVDIIHDFVHEAWSDYDGDFKTMVLASEYIQEYLTVEEINTCFKPDYYLRNVDQIYAAILGDNQEQELKLPSFV